MENQPLWYMCMLSQYQPLIKRSMVIVAFCSLKVHPLALDNTNPKINHHYIILYSCGLHSLCSLYALCLST